MNSVLTLANDLVVVLAEDPVQGPEFGKASPVGLLVVILLLISVFFLIRSMNKQLRKLPESFDTENPEPDQEFDEGTDSVDGTVDAATERADHPDESESKR